MIISELADDPGGTDAMLLRDAEVTAKEALEENSTSNSHPEAILWADGPDSKTLSMVAFILAFCSLMANVALASIVARLMNAPDRMCPENVVSSPSRRLGQMPELCTKLLPQEWIENPLAV